MPSYAAPTCAPATSSSKGACTPLSSLLPRQRDSARPARQTYTVADHLIDTSALARVLLRLNT
ncbi:hypothetical protein [Streptomyces sp. NPDC096132]|uniref:hypothetical protein n=1 Tax=Streptomyces sp. NPDC096132 TaxID=3366075 RepID=UPI0038085ACD